MPMGEWAWKEHLEQKQEEAFEMEAIEKRLAGIYAGMDPAQVALLTSGMATKRLEGAPTPVKGRLLEYQEAKRLTDGKPPQRAAVDGDGSAASGDAEENDAPLVTKRNMEALD